MAKNTTVKANKVETLTAGVKGKTVKADKVAPAVKADKGKGKTVKAKNPNPKGKTVKEVAPRQSSQFKLKGVKDGQAVGSVGLDGVNRTRAQWSGFSLSSLLKWVGFNGGTIDNARLLVKGLGLADITSPSTVSCQFYAGAKLANDENPNHQGAPADLNKEQAKQIKTLAGM
jgi:hypothetical protein